MLPQKYYHLLEKLLRSDRTSSVLLSLGKKFLKDSGIDEFERNAELILSYILNVPIFSLLVSKKKVGHLEVKKYCELLNLRSKRIPLQYITGKVNFYGHDFFIEKGIFIPRPETEILIESVVKIWRERFYSQKIKILDIGTGCGNIGITLAKEIKNCKVVGIDISEKILRIAEKNAKYHRVKSKIEFVKGDLFPEKNGKFHIIVSNPPYIPSDEIPSLPEEVKKEPIIAIDGGKEGMEKIVKIIFNSSKFLYNNGYLFLEIGYNQSEIIEKLDLEKYSLEYLKFINDFNGIKRVAVFKRI